MNFLEFKLFCYKNQDLTFKIEIFQPLKGHPANPQSHQSNILNHKAKTVKYEILFSHYLSIILLIVFPFHFNSIMIISVTEMNL